ncbi:MAG: hypothetical protein F4239_08700 [Gammaproteobacteria bacterium]|nr:hypothetical protein [Gammaproteobacteria bacterium]MYI90140.1 hypothetical protein [Gammaproteobacteria bacterium]
MNVLIIGLTLFVALHLIPSVPSLRTSLIESLGEKNTERYSRLLHLQAWR